MRQGRIDDVLVMCGRNYDDDEVGGVLVQRG